MLELTNIFHLFQMSNRQQSVEDTEFKLDKEIIEKANLLLRFAALTKTNIKPDTKQTKPDKLRKLSLHRRYGENDILKRVSHSEHFNAYLKTTTYT